MAFRSDTLFHLMSWVKQGWLISLYHIEFLGIFTVQEYGKVKGNSEEMGSFPATSDHLISGLPVKWPAVFVIN
jgi:hypothetical protein